MIYSLALLSLAVLWGAGKPAVTTDDIILKAEKLSFNPSTFYIADVVDKRKVKKAIAKLVPAPGIATQKPSLQEVDLKGGATLGIKTFLDQSLPANKKLRPIVVHINEFQVTEAARNQGQVDGKIALNLSFYLKRNGEEVHLLDYNGGAKYGRTAKQQGVVEPVLRQSLISTLTYLNTWMDQQVAHNEKLARGLKVTFSEPKLLEVSDTVFYDVKRPLVWSDFKSKPNGKSVYAASVFPGFGYKGKTEVIDGIVHLDLTMHVFMVQQMSWVKEAARNNYGLNHEQKHFDIVKLVAERFKNKIQPDSLTIEDYNSIIQYKYIEAYREMNRLQEQYDTETKHGIDSAMQANWNKRIDAELKKLGVK